MPSMVVTARPCTAPTGSMQERTGLPSTCTVQAPHCAMPQPNFVPVSPSMSRRTQSSGMSAGASKVFCSPLIVRVVAIKRLQNQQLLRNRGEARLGLTEVVNGSYRAAIRQKSGHIVCSRCPRKLIVAVEESSPKDEDAIF